MLQMCFTLTAVLARLTLCFVGRSSHFSIIRVLVAENLLLRQQLLLLKRKDKKRLTFSALRRLILAFICGLSGCPKRVAHRASILFSPATVLKFYRYLVKRRYSKLFSSKGKKKPGPQGTSDQLIQLILEIKRKNPRYSAHKIAGLLTARGHPISERTVRRILKKNGYAPDDINKSGPSWLIFIGNSFNSLWSVDFFWVPSVFLKIYVVMVIMDIHTRKTIGFAVRKYPIKGSDVCLMFSEIRSNAKGTTPKHLSTDHDPLWEYHLWKANLNVLEIDEIKSVPFVPESHPFIERRVGIARQDYLNHVLIFGESDLKRKLKSSEKYFDEGRVHSSLGFKTPMEMVENRESKAIDLNAVKWTKYCGGMYEVPFAA